MNFLRDNWLWIVGPIVLLALLVALFVAMTSGSGLENNTYDLG